MKRILLITLLSLCFNKLSFAQKSDQKATIVELIKQKDASISITQEHTSKKSNIHHVYVRQVVNGIEVIGTESSVHFNSQGEAIKVNDFFISTLTNTPVTSSPKVNANQAITNIAHKMGYNIKGLALIASKNSGKNIVFNTANISKKEIPAKLVYVYQHKKNLKLAWEINIQEITASNWYNFYVDATNGTIIYKDNWTVSCNILGAHEHHDHEKETYSFIGPINKVNKHTNTALAGSYNVYPIPIESPNYGGRSIVTDPDNAIASPFGWHDTNGANGAEFTITRGNNVHAYEDGNNVGYSPDGGAALNFNFPINTVYTIGVDESEDAIITNLFYWNNIVHDITYQYGFDEASGNFQSNNYGNGGVGNDFVNAEAQDGSGTCNANMGTGNDGGNPTMQMFTCGNRDGDIDNGVIVHEYVHGVSTRLTGGANNSGCLFNDEQMGEGWSDYYALIMTLEPGDVATDPRPIGTWLTGVGPNGPSIRTFPYSTDFAINPHTYNDIMSESIPHGVGSVWAAMLWEMTWELIQSNGFDPDIYNGTGGNNIALHLVTEGLKLQPCQPGFIDGRDAILAADEVLYNSAHICEIWEAFARRGLGFSATQGSSNNVNDGVEAFDLPPNFSNLDIIEEVCLADGVQTGLSGGTPIGGVYGGTGVTDDGNGMTFTFDPSIGGEGNTQITYLTTDMCTGLQVTLNNNITVTDEAPEIICKGIGILAQEGSTSDMPNLNIEDLNTVSTTISITDNFVITDLDVALNISHTYVQDMEITLRSPNGTETIIFNGANDGCSGNNLITRLDDESLNLFNCSNTGNAFSEPDYIPSNPLAVFDGESTQGVWTIFIEDTFNADPGVLTNWELQYTYEINSLPLDVFLDVSGNATVNTDDLLESVSVACGGYTATIGTTGNTTINFNTSNIGLNNVDITVTSDTGKVVTCTAIANVIENPNSDLQITCPDNITIQCGEDSSPANTGEAMAISSCNINPTISFTDTLENTCGNTQTITRTWFAQDICNTSTSLSCIQTIIIQDNTAPVANCPNDIMTITTPNQCTAIVTYDVTGTDTCGNVSVQQTGGLASGSEFPVGTTTNTFIITDDCGNTVDCSFVVTVENNNTVEAICQNITIALDENGIATINPQDINGGSGNICSNTEATININAFDCSNIGENEVTLTITDDLGNSSSCIAIVTVENNNTPQITCQNITVQLNENGIATITEQQVTENITGICEIASHEINNATFNCDNIGENEVIVTVTEANGNSNSCIAIVTVEDMTPPTAQCQSIIISLNENGIATITAEQLDNGSSDTCGNVTTQIEMDTFTCQNIGLNEVVFTVIDESNNSSTCVALVTVEDITAPIAQCQNITLQLNNAGNAFLNPDDIDGGSMDECSEVTLSIEDADTIFTCEQLGENEVTLTVTDASGNTSQCTAIVTIENDFTLEALCQNITAVINENGIATITPLNVYAGAIGPCPINNLSLDIDTFTCEQANTFVPVTLTATAENGTTTTCVSLVNVVDNIPPTISCPTETIIVPALEPYTIPDYLASGDVTMSDNCNNQLEYTQEPEAGTTVQAGQTTITATAIDPSGNETSCVFTIFVDPTLGVTQNNEIASLNLYPNPTTTKFYVEYNQSITIQEIQLFDIRGRMIKTFQQIQNTVENGFDIAEISNGNYFVKVTTDKGIKMIQLIKK